MFNLSYNGDTETDNDVHFSHKSQVGKIFDVDCVVSYYCHKMEWILLSTINKLKTLEFNSIQCSGIDTRVLHRGKYMSFMVQCSMYALGCDSIGSYKVYYFFFTDKDRG